MITEEMKSKIKEARTAYLQSVKEARLFLDKNTDRLRAEFEEKREPFLISWREVDIPARKVMDNLITRLGEDLSPEEKSALWRITV